MASRLHFQAGTMITVSGLLLGAVLASPASATATDTLTDPFDPSIPRVALVRETVEEDLRDPFAADTKLIATASTASPAHSDLIDPFVDAPHARNSKPATATPDLTDLADPFAH